MSIQNIFPGPKRPGDDEAYLFPGSKRPGDEGAKSKRQHLGSEEQSKLYEELNRLPLEMMEMTVHHLTDPELLESVSKISVIAKSAVLNVINTRNEHLAVKELKVLGDWSSSQAQHPSSDVYFYKEFLAYLQAQVQNPHARVRIDDSKLQELKQILTAYAASQVVERSRKLKQECYLDILSGKASIEGIDNKYASLKSELVSEALEHIISSSDNPQEARGWAVTSAVRGGYLEIVKVLLENGEISEYDRSWAFGTAAYKGYFEIVQAFLAHGVKISERQRGLGLMNAANGGHFEIVQALLSGGAQISKEDRSEALRSAIHLGNLKIVKVLLADGAKISVENKGKIVAEAVAKGHFQIVQALLSDEAQGSNEDRGAAPKIDHLKFVRNSASFTYSDRLPYEMKVKIAEHLTDIKDLENLAQVSHNWRDAALKVMALKKRKGSVFNKM